MMLQIERPQETSFLGPFPSDATFDRWRRGNSWKGWYYLAGTFVTLGAVGSIIAAGMTGFTAVLLLIGGPVLWLWHKEDWRRQSLDNAYKAVVAELQERGESEVPVQCETSPKLSDASPLFPWKLSTPTRNGVNALAFLGATLGATF